MSRVLTDIQEEFHTWKMGFGFEDEFKQAMEDRGVHVERGDTFNFCLPDFVMELDIVRLKKTQPSYKAWELVNIKPEKCIAIDIPKIQRYLTESKNSLLIFNIDYTPTFPTQGKYILSTRALKRLIKQHPERLKTFGDHNQSTKRLYISLDEMYDFNMFCTTIGETPSSFKNNSIHLKLRADAKRRIEPLFKAKQFVGLEPAKCVTLDTHKIQSYLDAQDNTLLVFEIDYTPMFFTHGKFVLSTRVLQEIMRKNPQRFRTFKDYEKGIMKERFYINIDEMHPYEDFIKVIQ